MRTPSARVVIPPEAGQGSAEGRRTFGQVREDEFARLERLGAAIPADDVAVCARVLGELVVAIAAATSAP